MYRQNNESSEAGDTNVVTYMRAVAAARVLSDLLRINSVRHLIIKGPVLVDRLYSDPRLRPFGDLDVLIAPGQFQCAVDVLDGGGFELIDKNWELLIAEGRSQLHFRSQRGIVVDLHWHLLNRASVRAGFNIDTASLLSRSRVFDLAGSEVAILSAEDQLLHLCVHAVLSPEEKELRYRDIALATRLDSPDWELFAQRATEWRARQSVGLALLRSERMFDAHVPHWLTDALMTGLTGRFSRLVVEAEASGRTKLISLWAEVVRDRYVDLCAVLIKRALRWLRNRSRRSYVVPSVFDPSGDAASRRAYLSYVKTQAHQS